MSSVGTGSTGLADKIQSGLTGTEIADYGPVVVPTFGEVVAINSWRDGADLHSAQTYRMSDGTLWIKYATLTNYAGTGAPDIIEWTDQDGNVVDAPEAT
jgi:hypothetical protein